MQPTMIASWLVIAAFAAFSEDGCSVGERVSSRSSQLELTLVQSGHDRLASLSGTVTAISLVQEGGSRRRIRLEQPVALRWLQDGDRRETQTVARLKDLAAGRYQRLELHLDPRQAPFQAEDTEGGTHPLADADADTATLSVSGPFVLERHGTLRLRVDPELPQRLWTGRDWRLIGPLRSVDRDQAGTLSGTVAPTLVENAPCADQGLPAADEGRGRGRALYVFTGTDRSPADLYLNSQGEPLRDPAPYSVAWVRKATDSGEYRFDNVMLPAGDYTVAFTCTALADVIDEDNLGNMAFPARANVSIRAGQRTTLELSR